MRPDEERAAAFARWFDERMCTRIRSWRFGTQYLDEDLPEQSDTNYLRLEAVPDATPPQDVVAAADAVIADAVSPPRIVIGSTALADRLALAFTAAGWTLHPYVLMVRTDSVALPPMDVGCEEVTLDAFVALRRSFDHTWSSRTYLEKVDRRVGSRYFVALVAGRPASGCVLWARAGDAQVDMVETAPTVRGRGAGSAAVAAAVEAAGTDWVHLYTEADNGPVAFYEALGFRGAGAIVEATREP